MYIFENGTEARNILSAKGLVLNSSRGGGGRHLVEEQKILHSKEGG